MNFTRKKLLFMALPVFLVGGFLVSLSSISAQEVDGENGFLEQLAEKLGLNADDLKNAADEIKEERKAEMDAEVDAKIQEALADGSLTDRQVEIFNAMKEIRGTLEFEKPDREEMKNMTQEEREAAREGMKSERTQAMIDALNNDYDLDVTQEELDELRQALEDLGIGRHKEGRGGRMGFGRE